MAEPIDPKSRSVGGLITILPESVTGPTPQNPAPFYQEGQVDETRVRSVADQIVRVFLNSLPSNYVSQVKGPYYTQQWQAAAEELARIQISSEDAYEDVDYDFTRSEVLFQFLADLIFPTSDTTGLPEIRGDVSYRTFLKKMVSLLLQGSRGVTLLEGVEALTDAEVSILEKIDFIGQPGIGWGLLDRFTFEINVSKHRRTTPGSIVDSHYHTVQINASGDGTTTGTTWADGSGPAHTHTISGFLVGEASAPGLPSHTHDLLSDFPDLPILLERNVRIVMRALRPGHTLYEYRNLFRETYRQVFSDLYHQVDLSAYYYDDFRKYCSGMKELSSISGTVLSDRYTINDPSLSFRFVRPGAPLIVETGPNAGRYSVRETVAFPFGDDPVSRSYTTSPSSLSGTATISGGAFVDPFQDWALAAPNEVLTLTSGPNAGSYLLETVLGLNGGPVGSAVGPETSVRPAICFLRIVGPRFPVSGLTSYRVELDRLGIRTPFEVVNEDVSNQFFSPPGSSSSFFTSRGPLVREGGDAHPATRADVEVLYDGLPVTVADVNPYTGEITLAAPIAFFLPGAHTVEVSYRWFPGPLMGFTGLNTQGLTLNSWNLGGGRNTTTSPTPTLLSGGYVTSRFPLSLGLGVYPTRRPPVRIAHRFLAFERSYTAGLNSPTTMILNQSPARISVPYAEADVVPVTVQYEGTAVPTAPWTAKGSVTGSSDGDRYTLSDLSNTEVGYWSRDFELPVSSAVGTAARFQVTSYVLDGVFTGVGFGFHNDRRLYLAGALVVNGLKHVGLLARPGEIRDLESWIVGPKASGTILTPTVVTCSLSEVPKLLSSGHRFQILSGNQSGVYTVESVFFDRTRNLATIVVEGPGFPENPELFGNRFADLVFETEWDAGMCTWRLYASTRNDSVQLLFGGATGGSLVTVVGGPVLASPAYLGPDVLPEGSGRYLWGSFSRRATSTTTWDFIRYLSTPDGGAKFSRGTLVDTGMTEDPEDGEWFLATPYGDSAVSAGVLRLTGTPADPNLDTQYGYGLVDPFLNGRRVVAMDARVSVERDTSGAGGLGLAIRDTHREARLGNILYQDLGPLGKAIYSRTSFSLVGATDYVSQGWAENHPDPSFGTALTYANGPATLLSGTGADNWLIARAFDTPLTTTDRTIEFRLSVDSFTVGPGALTGLSFFFLVSNRLVALNFSDPDTVNLVDVTFGPVASATVEWSDGQPRTYRVEVSPVANLVELYVEDVLETSFAYLAFPLFPAPNDGVSLGYLTDPGASFEASLYSFCMMEGTDGVAGLNRTFGIWKGGDLGDIDNWAIPRTDGLPTPNSDPSSVIVGMDWSVECWVRLFVDPTFGAIFIRPDLNPPPGYTGNFATQSLDPTAAWARVEYSQLPRAVDDAKFGQVLFGKLNPASSSIQFWNDVRYRVFTHTSIDYRAPQKMVLNQWNVVSSGDYLKDFTPEQVVVGSLSPTRVSLRPTHIFANRIFQVIVEGAPVPADRWRFNSDTQEITLFSPLPSTGYPVTVVFAVSKPVTTTYLQTQPLPESQTILNEGTPSVPMSQVGEATVSTVSGDGGPTPAFPPAVPANPNYFLRDQYLVRQFSDDAEKLYEQAEFFQLEDGGARGGISSFCDGLGRGSPSDVEVSGALFSENLSPIASPLAPNFRRGSGSFGPVLSASGGSFLGGVLGPASYVTPYSGPPPVMTGARAAMLMPTWPSAGVVPGSGAGALNREVTIILRP